MWTRQALFQLRTSRGRQGFNLRNGQSLLPTKYSDPVIVPSYRPLTLLLMAVIGATHGISYYDLCIILPDG